MKTLLEITIFSLLICILGVIIGLKLLPADNLFNQSVRPLFLRQPLLKDLFQLHQASDNRYYYLNKDYSQILIQVSYPPHITLNDQLESWLSDMVAQTTGKSIQLKLHQTPHIPPGSLSEEQIHIIQSNINLPSPDKDQAFLHIIYADSSQELPTNSGWVLSDDTLIIFYQRISEITDISSIRAQIEASTLKHEWGHLLGLPHISQTNCIMSEAVEVYPGRRYQAANIPQEYCDDSLSYLKVLSY